MAIIRQIYIYCIYTWISTLPLTLAQSDCDEWVLSQGSQYCFQAIQGTNSKSECVEICTARGSKLPLVTSEPVNQVLTKLIEERRLLEVWLGLEEFSDTWHWLDDLAEVDGQGCYQDNADQRDFLETVDIEDGVAVEACRSACYYKGHTYCGLQNGDTCWCGSSFGRYGLTVECNMPCVGNYSQNCGGPLANKVYSTQGVYSDWGSDQPNNHLFYQACGMADYSLDFRWNDAPCAELYGGLCETPTAESNCTGVYIEDRCIIASYERKNWFDWNYDCQNNQDGRLLHIRSPSMAEAVKLYVYEYIANHLDDGQGNRTSYWMNLAQKRWEWFTGEPILYNNWVNGKPNGWNLPCATIKESGHWYDIDCSLRKGCLCQIDNASHSVDIITRPPPPPAPTTTSITTPPTTSITTTAVPITPFFSLQGYGQWIILAGGILFFLILVAIIICQLRLCKKRKEKKEKELTHLYYGMDDPNNPSGVTSTGESGEPVFVDPTTLNPHAPDSKLNMLGSWEIPALTEHEEEARLKAKKKKVPTATLR